MATEAMNLTIDDVTILHYDANLPCGQVRYRTGALEYFLPTALRRSARVFLVALALTTVLRASRSAPNVAVQSIINAFDTEVHTSSSLGPGRTGATLTQYIAWCVMREGRG